jgi:hypothetical protein
MKMSKVATATRGHRCRRRAEILILVWFCEAGPYGWRKSTYKNGFWGIVSDFRHTTHTVFQEKSNENKNEHTYPTHAMECTRKISEHCLRPQKKMQSRYSKSDWFKLFPSKKRTRCIFKVHVCISQTAAKIEYMIHRLEAPCPELKYWTFYLSAIVAKILKLCVFSWRILDLFQNICSLWIKDAGFVHVAHVYTKSISSVTKIDENPGWFSSTFVADENQNSVPVQVVLLDPFHSHFRKIDFRQPYGPALSGHDKWQNIVIIWEKLEFSRM